MVSGELGATATKVSTMKVNPNSSDPNIKVTCVYTTAEEVNFLCTQDNMI